jgi:replicative DNA helicase
MGPYGNVCHLIAARYGVGKTPLAIGIAMHNALENNVPIAYWSGENSNEDIYFAMIAKLTNIPIKVLRQGIASWSEDRKQVVRDAQKRILDAPINLLPWGRRPLYQLRAGFERAAAKGAQIFVIDQITHVIGDPTIRDQNQQYDVLAEEIFSWKKHIPGWWLVLAQLKTKGVESEPLLRDVMWATRLEQNCDVGWTIDRIEADPARREKESTKYEREMAFVLKNKSLTEPERQSILDDLKQKHLCCGRARITQAKGRMGYGTWEAMIAFDQHARGFYNLSTQDAENQPQPAITNPYMPKEAVPF